MGRRGWGVRVRVRVGEAVRVRTGSIPRQGRVRMASTRGLRPSGVAMRPSRSQQHIHSWVPTAVVWMSGVTNRLLMIALGIRDASDRSSFSKRAFHCD